MNFFLTIFMLSNLLFLVHWLSIQLYSNYCISIGIIGLFNSIIKSSSPLCIGLNYIQFYTIKYYHSLWICMCISVIGLIKNYFNQLKIMSTK
jgi:hypothetical protein